jgi:membrane protein required for colicin V production
MAWVDVLLLVAFALSVMVGLIRGFVFEVMSLAGWLVAYLAANWFSVMAAPYVPFGQPGSSTNHAVSFAVTFIAALLLWSLLSRLIRLLIHATPLSLIDRLLGAVFGGARGALALLAIATVVALTPAVKSAGWQASVMAPWLMKALGELKPVLPAQLSQRLPLR